MARIMKIAGSSPIVNVTPHRNAMDKSEVKDSFKNTSVQDAELQSAGLRESIEGSDSVDMQLVEKVKGQIARGEVVLDPEKLAEAIMEIHAR